jgi:hypothetical protein
MTIDLDVEDEALAGASSPPGGLFKDARPSDLRFENAHLLAEYVGQAQRLVDSVIAETAKGRERAENLSIAGERALTLAKTAARDLKQVLATIPTVPNAVADAQRLSELIGSLAQERSALETVRGEVQRRQAELDQSRAALMADARAEVMRQLRARGFWWRVAYCFGGRAD